MSDEMSSDPVTDGEVGFNSSRESDIPDATPGHANICRRSDNASRQCPYITLLDNDLLIKHIIYCFHFSTSVRAEFFLSYIL